MVGQSNYAQDRARDSETGTGGKLREGGTQGVQQEVDLTYKKCTNCGRDAEQIVNATEHRRAGWYCVPCEQFMLVATDEEAKL